MKKKKWVSAALVAGMGSVCVLNTACSGDLGPAMRDAAISASATFVEATVLEILNSWRDTRTEQ